jgi:hypothetical protein
MITFAQLRSIYAAKYVYNPKNGFVNVGPNALLALRFGWLEAAEREIVHVSWNMPYFDVSTVTLQKPRSDKGSLRYEEHVVHACEHRLCPVSCELCKRLCSGDHLHGLNADQNHLCGCASHYLLSVTLFIFSFSSQEHSCSALCSAPGICQIDTIPQSVEATSTGRHETFQYTKVSLPLFK